ncbi:MAG: hypothetical protein ACOY3P_17540 [Planctomycetota bacterium]
MVHALAMIAVLLHSLLGCCWHHAHAGECANGQSCVQSSVRISDATIASSPQALDGHEHQHCCQHGSESVARSTEIDDDRSGSAIQRDTDGCCSHGEGSDPSHRGTCSEGACVFVRPDGSASTGLQFFAAIAVSVHAALDTVDVGRSLFSPAVAAPPRPSPLRLHLMLQVLLV